MGRSRTANAYRRRGGRELRKLRRRVMVPIEDVVRREVRAQCVRAGKSPSWSTQREQVFVAHVRRYLTGRRIWCALRHQDTRLHIINPDTGRPWLTLSLSTFLRDVI